MAHFEPPEPAIRPRKISADQAMQTARREAAEAIGELMAFWNFKPSMGRLWTVLYLSQHPLSADELIEATGMSSGTVSMTLNDLLEWQVVHREVSVDDRRRRFSAETDILAMVTRVFARRELQLVRQVHDRLAQAQQQVLNEGASSAPAQMLESRFVATRVGRLAELARMGQRMVEEFGRVGAVDLNAIRGVIGRGN